MEIKQKDNGRLTVKTGGSWTTPLFLDDVYYPSCADAARKFGVQPSTISDGFRGIGSFSSRLRLPKRKEIEELFNKPVKKRDKRRNKKPKIFCDDNGLCKLHLKQGGGQRPVIVEGVFYDSVGLFARKKGLSGGSRVMRLIDSGHMVYATLEEIVANHPDAIVVKRCPGTKNRSRSRLSRWPNFLVTRGPMAWSRSSAPTARYR